MPWVKNTITAASAALLAGSALLGAAEAAGAAPAAKARIPVITARFTGHSLTLSRHRVRAGRVVFRLPTGRGGHSLQLARLHGDYTFSQAQQDINAAFEGNVPAVDRLDNHVYFRGGINEAVHHVQRMSLTLGAGKYYVLDSSGTAFTTLTVTGKPVARKAVKSDATFTMLTYGFKTPKSIPHDGTLALRDISDQPHFTVLQHIKTDTTRRQIARLFSPTNMSQPKFLLKGSASSGILSPGKRQTLTYHLPKGRYVVACFWPDYKTGMPHADMGMWATLTLK